MAGQNGQNIKSFESKERFVLPEPAEKRAIRVCILMINKDNRMLASSVKPERDGIRWIFRRPAEDNYCCFPSTSVLYRMRNAGRNGD